MRNKVNFECVLDALDVYSDTQEEFDEWLSWVNTCVEEYKLMSKGYDLQRLNVKEEVIQ